MKKTVSPFRLIATACMALALGCATPLALAQVAPAREALPNVDKRLDGQNRPAVADGKQQALAKLRNRVPGLQADIDPLLKSPNFISSTHGFLTGPNGEGGAVSANAARALPDNDPHRSIKAFLNDNAGVFGHGAEVLTGAKINRDFVTAHNGLKTTIWQQQVDGIPVHEALMVGHVTKRGELVNLSTRFLPDAVKAADAGTANRAAAQSAPAISAAEAIVNAAKDVGSDLAISQVRGSGEPAGATRRQSFNASPVLSGESVAQLVWLPTSDASLRLSWQVVFTSRSRGEMFESIVDAQTGEVIIRRGLTEYISDATYNVYTSDSPSPFSPGHQNPSALQPPVVPRVLVVTNAVSVLASPNGWINDGDMETLGNNVDAHLDRDDDDQPDLPRPNGGATRVFDFPLDLAQGPDTYGDAAVVQLFYWNNWIHDKLYELGFTEEAGNFQRDNFGRGGIGNDPVLADAQDGLDLNDPFHDNNANMATPPDGFSPRMQMYKFSGPDPDRDGDLDGEIIIHEYVHGLSNRRVGGGAGLFNLQSRGLGEGWSDFYSLSLLSEPSDNVNGNYAEGGYATFNFFGLAANYYFGIRRYPYSTDLNKNPLTFKDIDPAQASAHPGIPRSPVVGGTPANAVHAQGEVWCSMLWEARAALINKYGPAVGNQLILQLVTDGMNLTPANPNFIQARDGILMADEVNSGGANRIELFGAFAKRGLGALASSPNSTTTAGVIESFDVPGLAYNATIVSGGNGNGLIDFNECNNLQIVLTNIGVSASNISVTLTTTTPEVIVVQSMSTYPDIPAGGSAENFVPFRITTSPEFICGTPLEFTLIIKSDVDTRTNLFRVPTGVLGLPVRFNNNNVFAIPDANPVGVRSPIVVSNFLGSIGKVEVALHLTHTFDADLLIQLISPDGKVVILSQNNGGSGDNFGFGCTPDSFRTRFADDARLPISSGTAPFVGSFQPEQPLSNFNLNSDTNANGIWQLEVIDQFAIDIGAIQCWSLFLTPQTCTDGGGECPGSDLGVTMVATPNPAVTATNLTYSIVVTNHGPSSAKTVVLSQTLPSGSIFASATNSQGNVQHSGGVVTFNFGRIPARGSATAAVVVIPTALGNISSTATVNSEQSDPDLSNNTVTVLGRVVLPSADLAVTISDFPDPVTAGGTLTYTISVTNRGPISATGVMLTNSLPSTAAFVSASSTQGSFVNVGGTIIYNLGSIQNGGGEVVTIVVRPTIVGTISATSRVASDESDSVPGNNSATATTTVAPAADLAISIVDMPHTIVVGSNVTFAIAVTNRGPNAATGVAINGTLPAAATFVTNALTQGTFTRNGNSFNATIGTLASGSSALLTIVMTSPLAPQDLTITANASGTQADPNLADNVASATAIVAAPFVSIAQAGSRLTVESFSPANGAIDLGETVTVEFGLRNSGNINSSNLTATLLSGNGVNSPSAPQNYGVLVADAQAVVRTFSFTASGAAGETLTATLQVQDGSGFTTNVTFNFTLPKLFTFANTNVITIPSVGSANPYPSSITVSGVTGLVSKVAITLNKLNHTFPDDIDVLLVGPNGQKVVLMSDAGGGNRLDNAVLTLDSTAALALSDEGQLVAGAFRPADFPPSDVFPNAPAGPLETSLSNFAGADANGVWSLYVVDDTSGDAGNIAGGWSITVTTIIPVNQIADLDIDVQDFASAVLVNQDVSYTFVIANNGPNTANSVLFSNAIPAGASLISATAPLSQIGTAVLGNLGNLAPGANVAVTVVLNLTSVGTTVNTASVFGSETDVNPANNSVSAVTEVTLPVADLALSISSTPTPTVGNSLVYTLVVSNQGPDRATSVVVTNRLPSSTGFVSATNSQGMSSHVAGVVTSQLGSLGAGATASIEITVTPSAVATITNVANVVTTSNDPEGTNNSVSVVSSVVLPFANIVASGSALVSENTPGNGAVDPGETVTVSLSLANTGTKNTANLVATLLSTGGVTSPTSAQPYGAVIVDGAAVSRPFTFTASAGAGGVITATLQLQDGAENLGNVVFTFDLPKLTNLVNNTPISIPNSGPATPYPTSITVSNQTGLVSKVAVTLNGLTHSFPDDLDILLVSPDGQKLMLMSDAGGAYAVSGVNIIFDQPGAPLPDAAQIVSGTFRPSDYEAGDSLPGLAPSAPYATTFAVFNGSAPNGVWSLYVNDDSAGDSGSISGGWSLALTTVNTVNPVANLSISVVDAPRPAYTGGTLTYSIVVSNQGPNAATGVVVTDTLPAGLSPMSATSSQGDWVLGTNSVTYNLGIVAAGSTASATLVVTPTAEGTLINNVAVRANEMDLLLSDNSAQTSTPVLVALAATLGSASVTTNGDFQLTLTGQPGLSYRVDVSTNLTSWTPVSTNTAAPNGTFKYTDTAARNFNTRFYRAVQLP